MVLSWVGRCHHTIPRKKLEPSMCFVQAYFLLITADFGHNFHIIAETQRAQKVAGMA